MVGREILSLGFNEKFIRTWEYYFDYCAAGFKTHTLGNYQVNLKITYGFIKILSLSFWQKKIDFFCNVGCIFTSWKCCCTKQSIQRFPFSILILLSEGRQHQHMEVSPSINFFVFLYFFIKLCWSFVSLIKYCTKFEALCLLLFYKKCILVLIHSSLLRMMKSHPWEILVALLSVFGYRNKYIKICF